MIWLLSEKEFMRMLVSCSSAPPPDDLTERLVDRPHQAARRLRYKTGNREKKEFLLRYLLLLVERTKCLSAFCGVLGRKVVINVSKVRSSSSDETSFFVRSSDEEAKRSQSTSAKGGEYLASLEDASN